MKIFLIGISILLGQSVFSQLIYPYAQNFENTTFHEHGYVDLDVNGPQLVCNENVPVDISGGFGYTWNLTNTYSLDNSLKMTFHEHDHVAHALHPRSRSEVAFVIDNKNTSYYTYHIYIPDNAEFVDNIIPGYYHMIQQFQSDLWNEDVMQQYNFTAANNQGDIVNTSNILASLNLYYKNDGNIRTLEFWTNDANDAKYYALGLIDEIEFQRRRKSLKINNAIEKGKWNEITIKINWSSESDEGYYQFWINRKPVIVDSFGNPNLFEYNASVHNSTDAPFKVQGANVAATNDNYPIKVAGNMKIGHYRNNISYTQSLYIDDFRITRDFPPPYSSVLYSKLIDNQCGITLSAGDLTLYANELPNAVNYYFKFTKTSTSGLPLILNSQGSFIDISNHSFFTTDKTYQVEVKVNGGNYGPPCTFTTPYLTTLESKYCNKVLPIEDWTIKANKLPFTNNYKFRFTRKDTSLQYVIDKTEPTVNLRDDDGYLGYFVPGKTYLVEVGNPNHAYGAICEITLPAQTKLTDTFCNMPISPYDMNIYSYPIPGAVSYTFHFLTQGGLLPRIISNSVPSVDISNDSYFSTGKKYDVKVKVNNGSYGEICTITTPHLTKLKSNYCNVTLPIHDWTIKANELPYTNNYKFHFIRESDGANYWIDKTEPVVNLRDNDGYQGYFIPGETYLVEVCNPIHAFGSLCEISLPELQDKYAIVYPPL